MKKNEVFKIIVAELDRISEQKTKPIRVAINGIEGTGKTIFANKLTKFLKQRSKIAIQVSIDGFHFNKEHRYKQGRNSANGYFKK